ncbi:MAG: hypothetical protein QM564_13615 [Bergeyella sp.]
MKEYIVKREMVLRLVSLLFVVGSVFLDDLVMKLALLFIGVLGLILIANAKGQKSLVILFSVLLLAAVGGYFYLKMQQG